uniref:Uncharacterized protein n=1 Tax=Opuntia streptacantha TaxID=393608 RepID=A0A7C8Z1J0_OPUST
MTHPSQPYVFSKELCTMHLEIYITNNGFSIFISTQVLLLEAYSHYVAWGLCLAQTEGGILSTVSSPTLRSLVNFCFIPAISSNFFERKLPSLYTSPSSSFCSQRRCSGLAMGKLTTELNPLVEMPSVHTN